MQNLVSKNPILRFKLGKKIIKGLYGLKPHEILGGSVNGETVGYVNIPGKGYVAIDAKGNAYTYGELLRQKNKIKFERNSFRPIKLTNYDRLQIHLAATLPTDNRKITSWIRDHSNNIANYWAKQDVPKQITTTNKVINLKDPEELLLTKDKGPTTVSTDIKNLLSKTKSAPVNNNSIFLDPMGGWKRSMKDQILDTESLNMLEELGWSGNAEKILRLLNLNNIGGYYVKEDNKWGNQSKSALKAYYDRWKAKLQINPPTDPVAVNLDQAYQAQKPSNQPSAFPKVEMPYTSTGTYNLDNSRTLKTLGIKDYNSLFNFVERNPGSAIASDLKLRFGETSRWNQLNIENEIGIGGHYGRMNRNALWGYLAGLKNKYNLDYARKLGMMMLGYNKQGGQLVSRNPVKRFKSNFRLVAQ